MATYTIALNERTSSGKALTAYLNSLGVIIDKVTTKKKPKPDPTLMSREEFFAKIDRSRQQAREGKVTRIENKEELKKFLLTL